MNLCYLILCLANIILNGKKQQIYLMEKNKLSINK